LQVFVLNILVYINIFNVFCKYEENQYEEINSLSGSLLRELAIVIGGPHKVGGYD
jgi:hypothetical protein